MSITWVKWIGLAALLTLVFLYGVPTLTTVTGGTLPPRFNSPDETANFWWASRLAHNQGLKIAEPLNALAANQIHLRSDNVTPTGDIVPGSFVGWILLLGALGWLVGAWIIPWVTPFMAITALWCWYRLIGKYLGRGVGIMAAVILAIQPAWWYYTTRSLFANVAVVALAIIATWLFDQALNRSTHRTGWWLATGVVAGLAATVRPAELPWLALIAVVLLWNQRAHLSWPAIGWLGGGVVLVGLPTLLVQWWLYGSPVVTGYQSLQSAGGDQVAVVKHWFDLILPAGFHPLRAGRHAYAYLIQFMGWWWGPALVAGLAALMRSWQVRTNRPAMSQLVWWYTATTVVIGVWLLIQYGSWSVQDNISGHLTIGTSYVRYWLPLAVLMTPYLAWFVISVLRRIKLMPWRVMVGTLILLWLVGPAYQVVVWSEEGVVAVAEAVAHYQLVNHAAAGQLTMNQQTPVIISDRSDKIFWPSIRPITFLGQAQIWAPTTSLARQVPVYYYSHNQLTAENLDRLRSFIAPFGCTWQAQPPLTTADSLYRLTCP